MSFALIFDVGYLMVRREIIKNAMDFSNMAAYREISTEKLAVNELYIDEVLAEETFEETLQHNLKLDSSLDPLSDSMASDTVKIVSFEVFNPDKLPATDSVGNLVEEVAVHSRIVVSLKPMFIGLFKTVDLPVAITTDIPKIIEISTD